MRKIFVLIIAVLVIWLALDRIYGVENAPDLGISPSPHPAGTSGPASEGKGSNSQVFIKKDSNGLVDTSDWQAYQNKHEGYNVKFHPWWWFRRYIGIGGEHTLSITAFDKSPLSEKPSQYIAPIIIQTMDLPADDIVKDQQLLEHFSSSEASLGGQSAIRTSGRWPEDSVFPNAQQYVVVTEHNGLTYVIMYLDLDSSGAYLELFNAMVEEFRFLD